MCFVCIDFVFFFKQKTAYEMRISDWSSDVCSSDLSAAFHHLQDRLSNRRPSRHAGGENRTHPAGRPARSCSGPRRSGAARGGHFQGRHRTVADTPDRGAERAGTRRGGRSEERRVGKEGVSTCRTRGSPAHEKKTQKNKRE